MPHFHIIFVTVASTYILWGEANLVGDELFWCCPECKEQVKVPVNFVGEAKNGLFFLVSERPMKSRLKAVSLYEEMNIPEVVCLHNETVLETCAKKSKILTGNPEWERLFGGDFFK